MKKTILTMMVLAVTLAAGAQQTTIPETPETRRSNAQLTLIPKVGINYSWTTLNTWAGHSAGIAKPDISGLVGVVVGAEAEYRMQPWLGLSAAVLYSMQGRKYDDTEVLKQAATSQVSKEYHHFINIPLTANFYVVDRLAVRTGLQFGYLFHQSGTLDTPYDNFPSHSISGQPAKFDISIPVGVSYALQNGLQFDLRYNHGLNNLSWSDGLRKEKNRVVQFTVGYRFDLLK